MLQDESADTIALNVCIAILSMAIAKRLYTHARLIIYNENKNLNNRLRLKY